MNILMLLAGESKDMEYKGYNFSKNVVEVEGKPLIEHVYNNFHSVENKNVIYVIKKSDVDKSHIDSVIKLMDSNAKIVVAEGVTEGALCSALLSINHINNDEELIIVNGDQIIDVDFENVVNHFRENNYDGGTIIFESIHPRWSYVKLDEDKCVIEAAEKRPISRYATAGFYYFRKGREFVDNAMETIRKDCSVNGKYFVCPVFNQMVLENKKIGTYSINRKKYYPLFTEQEIKEYEAKVQRNSMEE